MSKLSEFFKQIFSGKKASGLTTTQMRAGNPETSQVQGLRLVKSIPFFGRKPFKEQYKILLFLLVPTAIATVGTVIYSTTQASHIAQRVELSTQLQMLSQRTARLAAQLSIGEASAAPLLADAVNQINENLDVLKNGNSELAPTSGPPVPILDKAISAWQADEARTTRLTSATDSLVDLREQINFIYDASMAGSGVIEKMRILRTDQGADLSQMSLINALSNSLREIQLLMHTLETAVLIPENAISDLSHSSNVATQALKILLQGDERIGIRGNTDPGLLERIHTVNTMNRLITAEGPKLNTMLRSVKDAKVAAYELGTVADDNLNNLRALTDAYNVKLESAETMNTLAFISGLLPLLIGFFWIWLKLQETRFTTAQVEESIMHLMTDLISISDGNLALRARVAENITGSIADSLNLTIARLNRTMANVKDSSMSVRQGTEQMTNDAAVILEAVRDQSLKIKDASSSVNSISDSVQAVAFAAEQSFEVARQQQDATDQGRQAVSDVISSMDSIREQIQDTAKRIKRLGESAQEIDEIIELISDTTEQTNVLAMNASIQAAAAGEAGRGFRAVATEVQRLAERSDQSLKRIVALIRSMQADTQNAVSAMERSTQEVVAGAQTTNKAGEALSQIESVSSELNNLIAAITEATQQQAQEAKNITNRMSEILLISNNTARGVEQTTAGIQTISVLAGDLDESMGQFKLQ